MRPIYLFKDRDTHVGNNVTTRDPWHSFSLMAGWECRELCSEGIHSWMRGEGAALCCKDMLLFGRERKNRSNWDLMKTTRICDSIEQV